MFENSKRNIMKQLKVLNLKLGGDCNLGCPHCHCRPSRFEKNTKVYDWIKSQNYDRISFSGGEPLLYIETIKEAVSAIGELEYRIVTNGTLLTDEIVEYLNENNFTVLVSYDGENGARDSAIEPRWDMVSKLKKTGLSVCCYPGNMDFAKIGSDIEQLKVKHELRNIPTFGYLQSVEFPHQTEYATNELVSDKEVEDYLQQTQLQLLFMFEQYATGAPLDGLFLLKKCLKKWWIKKDYQGCRCCNPMAHAVTIDGRFMLCSYGNTFVGDINSGIDFEKVAKAIPKRCQTCELWDVCKNTCVANVTENECKIAHAMNAFLETTIDTYNVRERLERDIQSLHNNNQLEREVELPERKRIITNGNGTNQV